MKKEEMKEKTTKEKTTKEKTMKEKVAKEKVAKEKVVEEKTVKKQANTSNESEKSIKELVMITGASRGMGQYYARYYEAVGFDLILVAKPNDGLASFAKTIKDVNVHQEEIDLTDINEIEKLYEKYKKFNVTTIVNNAGFGNYGTFADSNVNKQLTMIDLNVKAVHANSHFWAKKFIKQDKGLIINVASIAAFLPGPYMSTYFATKSYVRKITTAMNWEFKHKKQNVRAVAICPGPVKTDFWNISSGTYDAKDKNAKLINKSFLPALEPKTLVYKALNKIYRHPKKQIIFVGAINSLLPVFERFFPSKIQMFVAKKFNDSQKPEKLSVKK